MPSFWDNKGLTVIEALAATTILLVGIACVGAMLRLSMMNDRSSVSSRVGDAVAQEVAEQLRGEVSNSITAVANLSSIQLSDPNFALVGTNDPVPGCPATVNCIEQFGTYRGLNYRWRVDDGPDPAVDPTGQLWAQTWRLRITVGWDDCSNPPGSCTDMGGGRWSYRSTQLTTFLGPFR